MAYNIIVGRNEEDKKKYGEKGVVLLGKAYVKMGRTTSLSNYVYMDVAKGHVVYVVGKRGGGKCTKGDTPVRIADGSLKKIEQLFEEYRNHSKVILKNETELLLKLKKKLEVISMNKEMKLQPMEVSNIYRKKVKEELIKINTSSGRFIVVTKEHPLFKMDKNSSWVEAYLLKEGDCIAIPKDNSDNICKDEIKEIIKIPHEGFVYDLTVPKTHNFIAGDNGGIVCHNSYTLGVMAEGMIDLPKEIKKNLSIILMDTMGIYWTMKYPNEKDAELLEQWSMEGKGLDVKIYTPFGFVEKYKKEGIPTDFPFSIKPSDLNSEDWRLAFELGKSDPVTIIIEKLLGDFADEGVEDYSIEDMIEEIKKDKTFEDNDKNGAINRLRGAEHWGLFSDEGTDPLELAKGGQVTVLDLSCYAMQGGWGVKSLVLGLIGTKIFNHRMSVRKAEELESIKVGYSYFQTESEVGKKKQEPIVWIVVDEAHEALPKGGKTAATDALVTIMREGRQPGVCLVLATQQPGKVHSDVMSQSDIVIAHRITAKPDVEALASMSQSYLTKSLPRMLDELPRVKGAALVLDDNSERFYPIRVRPRFTWHGGEAPSAVKYKRKLELGLD